MKILHLTDFHYSSKHNFDQAKIVESLIKDLQNEKEIDFLLFTGDLVFSGEKMEDFVSAKNQLLNKVSDSLNIAKDKVFICCGNHDVFRNQELQDTADKIKCIASSSELEDFLKRQEGKSFKESLKNLKNYNVFQSDFYREFSAGQTDSLDELYTIHKRIIGGQNIGILSINSAWRAIDSDTDRGNLLFPISILKKAIAETIKDTTFRILLLHHPISDFKDWNSSDIEDLIYPNFHLLFSGHLHKKKQTLQICPDEGILCCASPATLTSGGTIGYSLVNVDIDTYDIELKNSVYNSQDNIFLHPTSSIHTSIPVNNEKKDFINFRKTLRKRYFEELERANELFISYGEKDNNKSFKELFTDPVLKNKTAAQIANTQKRTTSVISINEIIASSNNYVINGKDKSGKTSILYKALLDLLLDFTMYKTIPIYFDSKKYTTLSKPFDIYKYISTYYEMNYAKAEGLPSMYPIRLLIDNYDTKNIDFNSAISKFLDDNKSSSFLVITEEKLDTTFTSLQFDDRTYTNLYIHEISRPEVRALTYKWPNLTPEKKEIILEKIYGIFNQLNIPANYWTVSLFIWIFETNSDANFHNSFDLIQLYIDSLLDRKRLALDKSIKLKFDDFKLYLSELAYFLFFNRSTIGYTASYTEIVDFTDSYRKKHRRFVIEVKDIIELVMEKRILRKTHENNYTFRLNGVFEYFIALYMSNDKKFTNDVITNEHFYLSFKNELELYAGFEKNGEKFLKRIFLRTKEIFKSVNERYSKTKIDSQMSLLFSDVFDVSQPISKLGEKITKSLPEATKDKMLDEIKPIDFHKSEVKVKEYLEKIEDSSENLETALYILARVFRNSKVENEKHIKINEVLDYILNATCYLGFKLIEEIDDKEKNSEELDGEDENAIIKLMTNFVPLIIQTFFYESLAQNDLERILIEKIDELKKDSKNNQFKLFILYFTLIDLDLASHKELILDVVKLVNLDILRQTIILKLYVYLMLKCGNNRKLEEFIKKQIELQTIKNNPKLDKGDIQRNLSKTSKLLMLKRGRK